MRKERLSKTTAFCIPIDSSSNMQGNSWIWKADQFEALTSIPIEDRGFRYGMSVFETLAVCGGATILASQHLHRLETAAAGLDFPIEQSALSGTFTFLERPPLQEGLIRIHWTAGDGKSPADPVVEGRLILRCEEIPLPGSSLAPLVQDLSLVEFEVLFNELDKWKTGNYLQRSRLLAEARHKRGAKEALLWDAHSGLLISAIMANVFLVTDNGQLVTPSLQQAGCRNGTVREWIMKHCGGEEKEITPAEVSSAQQILLTNSRFGVASTRHLEARAQGTIFFEKGTISEKVQHSYREFLYRSRMKNR